MSSTPGSEWAEGLKAIEEFDWGIQGDEHHDQPSQTNLQGGMDTQPPSQAPPTQHPQNVTSITVPAASQEDAQSTEIARWQNELNFFDNLGLMPFERLAEALQGVGLEEDDEEDDESLYEDEPEVAPGPSDPVFEDSGMHMDPPRDFEMEDVIPSSSRVTPSSSRVTPSSSQVIPSSSQVIPSSSQVIQSSSQNTGQPVQTSTPSIFRTPPALGNLPIFEAEEQGDGAELDPSNPNKRRRVRFSREGVPEAESSQVVPAGSVSQIPIQAGSFSNTPSMLASDPTPMAQHNLARSAGLATPSPFAFPSIHTTPVRSGFMETGGTEPMNTEEDDTDDLYSMPERVVRPAPAQARPFTEMDVDFPAPAQSASSASALPFARADGTPEDILATQTAMRNIPAGIQYGPGLPLSPEAMEAVEEIRRMASANDCHSFTRLQNGTHHANGNHQSQQTETPAARIPSNPFASSEAIQPPARVFESPFASTQGFQPGVRPSTHPGGRLQPTTDVQGSTPDKEARLVRRREKMPARDHDVPTASGAGPATITRPAPSAPTPAANPSIAQQPGSGNRKRKPPHHRARLTESDARGSTFVPVDYTSSSVAELRQMINDRQLPKLPGRAVKDALMAHLGNHDQMSARDYSRLTVPALRILLRQRGIQTLTKTKKDVLIGLLKEGDAERGGEEGKRREGEGRAAAAAAPQKPAEEAGAGQEGPAGRGISEISSTEPFESFLEGLSVTAQAVLKGAEEALDSPAPE